jgi:hypothetical protein
MARNGLTSRLLGIMGIRPDIKETVNPFKEMGTSGTAIQSGYVVSNERNYKARGSMRYETANDILINAAIVGAGMRFFANLVAKPKWTFDPAKDAEGGRSSKEAMAVAEFVEDCLFDCSDSFPRIVRRMSAFRFYGFGTHEWTIKKRFDGRIGFESIEARPWHTIEQWDTDDKGSIIGVVQRAPVTGETLYIPRRKLAYLVDDSFSDSPEGIGLWRHLVEPFERFKSYCKVEGMGFERDLRGIPIGRVPYTLLQKAVVDGVITEEQAKALSKPVEEFVSMSAKSTETGIVLDSSMHMTQTETGETVSNTPLFDMKLLTASGTGFADIGNAIDRVQYQMATIIGAENLLVGSGSTGSRALSEDKSRNLYLNVDGCLSDIVSAVNKDLIPILCAYNGIPCQLWPKAKTESAAYLDATTKSQILVNLSNAGAMTSIADPAVSEIRIEAGLSAATEAMMNMDSEMAMNDSPNGVQND